MKTTELIVRPKTIRDVARVSETLDDFGLNLRDWQHDIQRGGVHSRAEFEKRLSESPRLLRDRFDGGDVADAYLAAYAEWLADRAKIAPPRWCAYKTRVANDPWYSGSTREQLERTSPKTFRRRNLYTIPESIFAPRRGRPRVSQEQLKEKARLRQKDYRRRIRELVARAREAGL